MVKEREGRIGFLVSLLKTIVPLTLGKSNSCRLILDNLLRREYGNVFIRKTLNVIRHDRV